MQRFLEADVLSMTLKPGSWGSAELSAKPMHRKWATDKHCVRRKESVA